MAKELDEAVEAFGPARSMPGGVRNADAGWLKVRRERGRRRGARLDRHRRVSAEGYRILGIPGHLRRGAAGWRFFRDLVAAARSRAGHPTPHAGLVKRDRLPWRHSSAAEPTTAANLMAAATRSPPGRGAHPAALHLRPARRRIGICF